jgi:hypothetical protein
VIPISTDAFGDTVWSASSLNVTFVKFTAAKDANGIAATDTAIAILKSLFINNLLSSLVKNREQINEFDLSALLLF